MDVCEQCDPGYLLEIDSSSGTDVYTCSLIGPTLTTTLNYYVRAYDKGIKANDVDLLAMQQKTGRTFSSPYDFIGQAIYRVNNLSDISYWYNYASIEINIWIGKGKHYLFMCNSDITTYSEDFTDFCNEGIPELTMSYPKSDIVKLNVKPLDCGDK